MLALNSVNPEGILVRMNGYLHRYGLHGIAGEINGRSGAYNELREAFTKEYSKMKENPYVVIGFGFGLFDRFTEDLVLPYDGI